MENSSKIELGGIEEKIKEKVKDNAVGVFLEKFGGKEADTEKSIDISYLSGTGAISVRIYLFNIFNSSITFCFSKLILSVIVKFFPQFLYVNSR